MIKLLSMILILLNITSPLKISEEKINEFQKPQTLEELRNSNYLDIANLKSYDSRDYDIVTPIKNQRAYGRDTCWSYATLAASETSILRDGLYQNDLRNLDLSELNHAYLSFNNDPSKDPLNLTIGDNYNASFNRGYSMYGSSQRMTSWVSPTHEDYRENELKPNITEVAYLLEDYIHVNHNDINDIKQAIAKYGAVTVVYKINDWHEEYYYYNGNKNINDGDYHAVTIVGWDDTVSKDLYRYPPTLDGGWIVKNSWGTAHAEGDGYFMMSYDTPIKDVYAYKFASKEKYDYNYHYDSFTTRDAYLENNETVAAIYPVKKSSINNKEILKAVNVSILDTESPKKQKEGEISIDIYTNVEANESDIYSSKNNPTSGIHRANIKRKITHEGSYTLELKEGIELEKGEYFSIVVNVKSNNNKFKVALSTEGNDSNNDLTFYKNNSDWINSGLPNHRLVARIKAFSKSEKRNETIAKDLKYTNIVINNNNYRYNDLHEFDFNVYSDNDLLIKNEDYKIKESKINKIPGFTESTSDEDVVATMDIVLVGLGSWSGENKLSIPLKVGFHKLDQIFELKGNTIYINIDGTISNYEDISLPNDWYFTFNGPLKLGENSGNYLDYRGQDSLFYRKNMFDVIVNKSGTIVEKININKSQINLEKDIFIYNKEEHKPNVDISYEGKLLTINKDYVLSYQNNINAGTASIIIKGINKFNGEVVKNFIINKAKNNITNFEIVDNKFSSNAIYGDVIYKFYSDKDCLNEISKPTKEGTYYVKAIVLESENYEGFISEAKEYKIENNEEIINEKNNIIPIILYVSGGIIIFAILIFFIIKLLKKIRIV